MVSCCHVKEEKYCLSNNQVLHLISSHLIRGFFYNFQPLTFPDALQRVATPFITITNKKLWIQNDFKVKELLFYNLKYFLYEFYNIIRYL